MDKIEYFTNCFGKKFKIVNGKLELNSLNIDNEFGQGCVLLNYSPDDIAVGGFLNLSGCTCLVYLPDNLTVNGALYLDDCISLLSLPDNLNVDGYINLKRCTSLKHIGKNTLFEKIYFDEYEIACDHSGYKYLNIYESPESLKRSFTGKRVIDVIDDTRIYGTRYAEAIINGLDENGNFAIDIKGE